MFDFLLDAVPLPFNSSVGELIRMTATETSLAKLMSSKDDTDGVIDTLIDHTIAIVMIVVTKHRQNSKK